MQGSQVVAIQMREIVHQVSFHEGLIHIFFPGVVTTQIGNYEWFHQARTQVFMPQNFFQTFTTILAKIITYINYIIA